MLPAPISLILFLLALAAPAKAGSLISISGELTMQPLLSGYLTAENCSSTKVAATYQVRNGPGGLVYLDCDRTYFGEGDNPTFFTFTDTSGSERCAGRVKEHWPSTAATPNVLVSEWTIDRAQSGYRCSTIGNTYIVNFLID